MKHFLILISILPVILNAQERIMLNGGYINIQNGAYLVVENSNPDAITRMNSAGGIGMNDAFSRLRWHISNSTGTYSVPFVHGTDALPLVFTTSGGSGAGFFDFTTYQTPTWKNSDYLPPGVSNVYRGGMDNSVHLVDRFWLVSAQGYINKPSLNNVSFAYRDAEWNAAGNAIAEPFLKAQRYNSILNSWGDFAPAGVDNVSANSVDIPAIAGNQLFEWWTLVDSDFPLPVQLLYFTAQVHNNSVVQTSWKTSNEINTSHFIIERSTNGTEFFMAGMIPAAGNTTVDQYYTFLDPAPFRGRSFYRLKTVDNDSSFSYSVISPVVLTENDVRIYPNPAVDKVTVELGNNRAELITVTDANGKMVIHKIVSSGTVTLDVSALPAAVYWIRIINPSGFKMFKLLKGTP